jgi:cyclase
LIKELSAEFGSQSIVSSIQAKKRSKNNWEAFCLNGRQATGIDVLAWAKEVQSLGAGEILLSSVDCDGVGKGMDFELIEKISNNIDIPVIASSGASSIEELKFIFKNTNTSGIAIGKLLHENILSIQSIKKALNL